MKAGRSRRFIELITTSVVPLYVLLGIVLGPSLLGWTNADAAWLRGFGEAGIVLLLGVAGLQVEVPALVRTGWSGFGVAILGIAFTFAGVFLFTALWGSPAQESLYTALALSATSIGITTQVLHRFGLLRDVIGRSIVAAAVVDDVVVLYLLAVVHAALTDSIEIMRVSQSAVLALVAIAAIFLTTMWLGRQCRRWTHGASSLRIIIAILLIYLGAMGTHWAGLSTVVGGFFAGLGFGYGLGLTEANATAKRLNPLVLITVPFFFVLIGTRAEFSVLAEPAIVFFVIAVLGIAIGGKLIGGVMGAAQTLDSRRRILIGVGMAPRGEVALVVAGIGLVQGHLSHHAFVAIVLITLTTAIVIPVLMIRLAIGIARHSKPQESLP